MNAPVNRAESTALTLPQAGYEVGQVTDAAALILGPSFDRVRSFAELMAKGAVSVPKHLRGNMGDCMAITIQALGWKMNPFAVAQKTHLSQSGALGYEAQLVSAILVSTGAIEEEPEYEAIGDWSKVLGKVEERTGQKRDDGSGGGKYYIATYTKKDEEGLGVMVRAKLASSGKVRELPVMMSQAFPRFSTQWATDPFQQLCYLAIRKWGRLNTPGAILGVYTPEELEGSNPAEKFMGMAEVVTNAAPETYPEEKFTENLPAWKAVIAKGRKTPDDIIAMVSSLHPLTEAQVLAIKAIPAELVKAAGQRKPEPTTGPATAPAATYAEVADKLHKAETTNALNEAATLIAAVADEGQRGELNKIFDTRAAALTQ